tara:strand:- start:76 stop:468 length:393 start_codon:yes stop_codon:yes gene_type:complete
MTSIEGKPDRSFLGKIFKWWFILFNIIMVFWIYGGVTDSQESIDNSESEAEEVGKTIGTGIGLTIVCTIWLFGAVIFGMLAMVTKPSGTVIITKAEEKLDIAAKLTEAKQLFDSGVITQEEFDEIKRKYL